MGESGSGKCVIAQAIMGLLPKTLPVSGGSIRLEGEELNGARQARMRELRGARMSMIFQEPMTALNPVMRCGAQIDEVLRFHGQHAAGARRRKVLDLLREVALPEPERILASYPHQLSGGQRQRIMIAMALALEPALLIADEPTTALDVTTQAQILNLILELQKKHGMGVLFITHDFGVVAEIAHRVAVLREGRAGRDGREARRAAAAAARVHAHADPLGADARAALARSARRRERGADDEEPVQDLRRARLVRQPARSARGERRQPRGAQGPDARHRRRIGLRQIDGGALHRAPARAERAARSASAARISRA